MSTLSLTTDKAYLSDSRIPNISKSFTHKMAAKTSWHTYGTKLRHCHSTCSPRWWFSVVRQMSGGSECPLHGTVCVAKRGAYNPTKRSTFGRACDRPRRRRLRFRGPGSHKAAGPGDAAAANPPLILLRPGRRPSAGPTRCFARRIRVSMHYINSITERCFISTGPATYGAEATHQSWGSSRESV